MEVDDPPAESSGDSSLRSQMLDHLSLNNEAHFKSQQLNEPDLTSLEKREIAEAILDKNPGSFLLRFGSYLLEKHLDYFEDMTPDNYEVNYYISDLRKKYQRTNSKSVVRNRRLEAMRRLVDKGDYFSDEEMRKRDPLMYEHLVGQYLTEDEKMALHAERIEAKSFTGIILNAIDEKEIEDRLKSEKENEKEESESDKESCISTDMQYQQSAGSWGEFVQPESTNSSMKNKRKRRKNKRKKKMELLTDEEKTLMMNEFRSYMFSEFLGGKDSDFDYSKVDSNNDYDDLEMLESDQQDKYFDSESPELLSKGEESSDSAIACAPPPRDLVQKMADLET